MFDIILQKIYTTHNVIYYINYIKFSYVNKT